MAEAEVDFDVPLAGKPCKTWYKIVGDLKSGKTPLLVLHGGPGACHDYMLPVGDLAERFNVPCVFYDQIGNGKSTHLREKMGEGSFWTIDLFKKELSNLIDKLGIQQQYDILGHSWGGMLGAVFAVDRPPGLRRLIISNSPANMKDWVAAANKLREAMPDTNEVLTRHETAETTESEEYKQAVDKFYQQHLCRMNPFPPEATIALQRLEEDPTVYLTMNGPSEFHVIGTLKDFAMSSSSLASISAPTLLLNGAYDEATDDTLMAFFTGLTGTKVKWCRLENSAHLAHVEERKRYIEIVGGWLTSW